MLHQIGWLEAANGNSRQGKWRVAVANGFKEFGRISGIAARQKQQKSKKNCNIPQQRVLPKEYAVTGCFDHIATPKGRILVKWCSRAAPMLFAFYDVWCSHE